MKIICIALIGVALLAGSAAGAAKSGSVSLVAYSTPKDAYGKIISAFQKTSAGSGTDFSHDVELLLEPDAGCSEAMVERVVHLGFEGRAELVRDDDQHLLAQLTQEQAQLLELERGQIVYVRPSRETVFAVSAAATPPGLPRSA
jgi:ABC-type sulfate/molybdate transport systems ATPase subunit